MSDLTPPLPGDTPSALPPSPDSSTSHNLFFNDRELRAGWRLLIYIAILAAMIALLVGVGKAVSHFRHSQQQTQQKPQRQPSPSPLHLALGEGSFFAVLLIAAVIMAKIEKRRMGVYGLTARSAFRSDFWQGAAWGFGALSLLLLALFVLHDFNYGPLNAHGIEILKYGALWGMGFLLVGLTEEYTMRGYLQFTLGSGLNLLSSFIILALLAIMVFHAHLRANVQERLSFQATVLAVSLLILSAAVVGVLHAKKIKGFGFWAAALVTSFLFFFAHTGNPGENWIGLSQVFMIGIIFCFMLWRTGSLWFPVGFHAAWDWAQSFFYGTADSGLITRGHLLTATFHGPDWLTGGSVGPEGSTLMVPLNVLLFIALYFALPKRAASPQITAPAAPSVAATYPTP